MCNIDATMGINTPSFKFITRKGLQLYPLKGLSRSQWLELRQMGGAIGGSDVGSILGVNKRFSAIELFYQKVGITFSNLESINPYTYWGSAIERSLMHTAQFYDFNDPEAYLYNANEGIMMRSIKEFKYSVRNKKYPFANANVDGLIDFNRARFVARRLAEAKCTSRQASEMWETIPPYHIFQVMLYMAVLAPMLEEQVTEIYYLIDGNNLVGWEIEQNQQILDTIVEKCTEFHASVMKGIEIVHNELNPDLRMIALQELEPPADNTLAYEKFLSELYKKKSNYIRIDGTQELYEEALRYKAASAQEKSYKETKQISKNIIWQTLSRRNANVIDFGKSGRITYSDKLYVNVKPQSI
jgi:predicted phage-related endonuclease